MSEPLLPAPVEDNGTKALKDALEVTLRVAALNAAADIYQGAGGPSAVLENARRFLGFLKERDDE